MFYYFWRATVDTFFFMNHEALRYEGGGGGPQTGIFLLRPKLGCELEIQGHLHSVSILPRRKCPRLPTR